MTCYVFFSFFKLKQIKNEVPDRVDFECNNVFQTKIREKEVAK